MITNVSLKKTEARRRWIDAQKLNSFSPFGSGPKATTQAVEHLGYVQIDTIHVIERSHHHILFSRIPEYRTSDLQHAQTTSKSVFEYWTHALAYVPTRDYRFFMKDMTEAKRSPGSWFSSVKKEEIQKVLRRIKQEGPISIRDIDDDELVEKDHPWASRKPSKRALQLGFFTGDLVVSERVGMLKKYDLRDRHFEWRTGQPKPSAATEKQTLEYLLDRALRAQSIVSLDSICYLDAQRKPAIRSLIEKRVAKKELVPVAIEGVRHWIRAQELDQPAPETTDLVHLLSPFDPLVIQRKRLQLFFDYEHRFEAYLPKEKRVFGYFALPVLLGDEIVAAIDLKTDRDKKRLLIQKWTWLGKHRSQKKKIQIEESLGRFERFQLGSL